MSEWMLMITWVAFSWDPTYSDARRVPAAGEIKMFPLTLYSCRIAMHIWVDADACPAPIKDILYRAAERAKIAMTLVANQPLRTPRSPLIRTVQVARGIDVADSHIVRELKAGGDRKSVV